MAGKRYEGEMRPGSRVKVKSEDSEYHGREGMVSTTLLGFRVIVVFDGEEEGTSLSAFDLVTVSTSDRPTDMVQCVECGEMVPNRSNCVNCRRKDPAVLEGIGPLEVVEIEGGSQ